MTRHPATERHLRLEVRYEPRRNSQESLDDRSQQPLGLVPRPTKGEAQHQPGFHGNIRVCRRPTAPSGLRRRPGGDRLGRDPDGQAASPRTAASYSFSTL